MPALAQSESAGTKIQSYNFGQKTRKEPVPGVHIYSRQYDLISISQRTPFRFQLKHADGELCHAKLDQIQLSLAISYQLKVLHFNVLLEKLVRVGGVRLGVLWLRELEIGLSLAWQLKMKMKFNVLSRELFRNDLLRNNH